MSGGREGDDLHYRRDRKARKQRTQYYHFHVLEPASGEYLLSSTCLSCSVVWLVIHDTPRVFTIIIITNECFLTSCSIPQHGLQVLL